MIIARKQSRLLTVIPTVSTVSRCCDNDDCWQKFSLHKLTICCHVFYSRLLQ